MYIVFDKGHWFSRVDTRNTRCQSDQSMTESPFSENGQWPSWPTGAGASRRVARMISRGLHVACLSSRWKPRLASLSAPRHFPLSPSPRAAPSHRSRPPLPTARRRRRARSPPQKRVAPFTLSLAVIPSPVSTVQSCQSSLGKGQSSVFFHRRHGCSRRSWRSTRPAFLAPLPLLLRLMLGSRNTVVARRVALLGCDAVSSSEPAVPWPSAAVAIATPASGVNSCNRRFP